MKAYIYRVLVRADESADLPLLPLAPETGGEFCGWGCQGDFTGAEDKGQKGEVWEYTTDRPTVMESMLDQSSQVLAYAQSEEVYV